MTDLERLGAVAAIAAYVIFLAWFSRKAAMDLDERGYPGWIFGILVLVLFPVGVLAWWLFRIPRSHRR